MNKEEIKKFEKMFCKNCKDKKLCDKGLVITQKEIVCADRNIHMQKGK